MGRRLTPSTRKLIGSLLEADGFDKSEAPRKQVRITMGDHPVSQAMERDEGGGAVEVLAKSILRDLKGFDKDRVVSLAFDSDPSVGNLNGGLFKQKVKLLPDTILKRIAIQDDLVACIVQARSNQMSAFGLQRVDRHGYGFVMELSKEANERIESEADMERRKKAKEEIQKRIAAASKRLASCGREHEDPTDRETFADWLRKSTRNALVVGRIATEACFSDEMDGTHKFHSFRARDAGTIYRMTPQQNAAQALRETAIKMLEQLKDLKIDRSRWEKDEYEWCQVIEGTPRQVFTAKELLVRNFYPVTDVEVDGYPVTPIDTAIAAVTTHINITTHNKLYFQSGRAARGMLIIKSDDADQTVTDRIRQQFNASINSVSNAWRMPVFGCGAEDEVEWIPIDQGGRDMEFQYLADQNARVILSVFQMSPEELPGWSYLSRGTNNQALSESNNEYRLEAHRDLGIRPLIRQFEDFINHELMPLVAPDLADDVVVRLEGLDAENPEKESVVIGQWMPLHGTYDEVLTKVEKRPVGKEFGGEFPLNPQFQAVLDKYFTVGQILEKFMGVPNASKDPALAYMRDPFFFQWQEMKQQEAMAQAQAQQQAQGGGQPPPGGGGGGEQGGGGGQPDAEADPRRDEAKTEKQQSEASQQPAPQAQQGGGEDLTRALDQAIGMLQKGERQLPPKARAILAQHRAFLDRAMAEMDFDEATKKIAAAVKLE